MIHKNILIKKQYDLAHDLAYDHFYKELIWFDLVYPFLFLENFY